MLQWMNNVPIKGEYGMVASKPVVVAPLKNATTSLDVTTLNKSISGAGLYASPMVPITIPEIPLHQTSSDRILHAWTGNALAELHGELAHRGANNMYVRCILTRFDWDLIHTFVIQHLAAETADTATRDALTRMLVKVHEQRNWIDTVSKTTVS